MAEPSVMRSYPFGPIVGLEIDPVYFRLQEHEPLSRVRLPYGDGGLAAGSLRRCPCGIG